ncbi:alpha-ketoacid dehydrogenase subunit beta [Pseudonocardia sp. K10HN5]|uniref:Alpha-ketoacid dehydrogenase subunit beta n=2 Tax=Pseudonocardia acidicola TaxID=2724939 RepID=A0ABX1S9I0_9PSEU|nr:alpha-ketoacid dehydrogenase subunit beta [Pseudonocardia acidicola]
MTLVAAENSALDLEMARDPKVVLLGEDIADPAGGVFKVSKGLSTKYGTARVRATPIVEQSIVGTSVGLALGGYRPVAEIMFFDFITMAMDQLVNHAAKFRYMSGGATPTPITVRTVVGSSRFGAQHAQSLEAWFMHTPGVKVVMPSSAADAKGLLTAAIRDDDPVLFIEHINLAYGRKGQVPVGEHVVPIGKANMLRSGDAVTLVTYGAQVPIVLDAAEQLAADGIEAEVIDLRSLVPLDIETVLESVERTRRAVVVHEATRFAGPGAEIAAQVNEHLFGELLAPVQRLGAGFVPIPFSPSLSNFPTAAVVVESVKSIL